MKICVYSMAKNEEHFAQRWAAAASEADYMTVLDTGSSDRTVEILETNGVIVGELFFTPWQTIDEYKELCLKNKNPWRWDVARNASMKLIPADTDICVRVDLDEYFSPGWRKILEKVWNKEATRAMYKYVWSFNPDGSEGTVFNANNITAYGKYRYVYANHEVPEFIGPGVEKIVSMDSCQLNHTPVWKSSRSTNLPLLELAVSEDPDNPRNMHYLGREYMYLKKYTQAVEILKKHINMSASLWDAERAASMRFLAACFKSNGDEESAELWYTRAIAEAPRFREGYVGLEQLMYKQKQWRRCAYYGEQAVNISIRDMSYISESDAWGSLPWDILSIAYWNLLNPKLAITCAKIALQFEPDNERIKNNINLFTE